MEFPALKEAEGKLAALKKEMAGIFTEAGPEMDMAKVKTIDGDSAAKVAYIRQRNEEAGDLGRKVAELRSLGDIADGVQSDEARYTKSGSAEKGGTADPTDDPYNTGESFADQAIKAGIVGPNRKLGAKGDLSVKTLLATTAGWAPSAIRTDVVVPIAKRPVELVDIIPKVATSQATGTYMEQTTRTNAAAETAEGAAKPEATIVYTERTWVARKIAVILPVTDEQLDDIPQIRSILENDLVEMVRQRLSDQIAAGNGTAPNLLGVLNVSGIQTQALGADPVPDAVYKAMVKVMTGTGMAVPDHYVTNPLDWQDIRLLRTADGIYIWGNPADAGPNRIWGLDVTLAQGMTQNTAVVGDFNHFSRMYVKQDVQVDIGYVNDDFSKNRQTLRAEMRVALVWLRPAAFSTVTGV